MTDLTPIDDLPDLPDLTPPEGLGAVGSAYWHRVADEYDASPTEEPTLGEVCRVLDSIEAVEAGLRQHGYIGADGKPSPLLAEARQQRATLVRLLGLLDLPLAEDEDQAKARVAGRSRSARRAARARWTTH